MQDVNGHTVLHNAVMNNNLNVVKKLVKQYNAIQTLDQYFDALDCAQQNRKKLETDPKIKQEIKQEIVSIFEYLRDYKPKDENLKDR